MACSDCFTTPDRPVLTIEQVSTLIDDGFVGGGDCILFKRGLTWGFDSMSDLDPDYDPDDPEAVERLRDTPIRLGARLRVESLEDTSAESPLYIGA